MNKNQTKYEKTHKKAKSMVQTLKRRGILERNKRKFEFRILQREMLCKIVNVKVSILVFPSF